MASHRSRTSSPIETETRREKKQSGLQGPRSHPALLLPGLVVCELVADHPMEPEQCKPSHTHENPVSCDPVHNYVCSDHFSTEIEGNNFTQYCHRI